MYFGNARGRLARSAPFLLWVVSVSFLSIACGGAGNAGSNGIVAIDRLRLRSSTAEAARIVGELKVGDRVSIVEQGEAEGVAWAKVNGPDGSTGWVQMRNLIDQEAFDKSHQMETELSSIQAQAIGRSKATLKLRMTPDRATEENVLNTLPSATELEILRRERKPRPAANSEPKEGEPASDQKYDEWYQVRVKTSQVTPAGWIYGGSIELQIPPDIVYYPSSGRRIVGWQSLGEAKDEQGRAGEHFLVLERAIFGSDQDSDFDRVKVLAYDPAARDYSTPFREDIRGRFPIKLNLNGRSATLEIPTADPQRPISYQIQVSDAGRFEVTRTTPKDPVQPRRKK